MRLSLGIRPVEKRFSSGTASGFNLSWEGQDSTTCGYTVEWCILGNAVPCTLRWMKVPEGSNTLFLPASKFIFFSRHCMCVLKVLLTLAFIFFFLFAGDFKAGCRYTFSIYGCTENGHRLLETQTGYSQELSEC